MVCGGTIGAEEGGGVGGGEGGGEGGGAGGGEGGGGEAYIPIDRVVSGQGIMSWYVNRFICLYVYRFIDEAPL